MIVSAPGQSGMEEEMDELYVEGLATHGGPESYVASREGHDEALTGVPAGRAIEPRKVSSRVSALFTKRKATLRPALLRPARARAASGPRDLRSRACSETSCARTGRARVRPSAWSAGLQQRG
jgi:hypothetical protein